MKFFLPTLFAFNMVFWVTDVWEGNTGLTASLIAEVCICEEGRWISVRKYAFPLPFQLQSRQHFRKGRTYVISSAPLLR